MLSYTVPEQQQHRRVRVRLEGSTWSSPFGLDEVEAYFRVQSLTVFVLYTSQQFCLVSWLCLDRARFGSSLGTSLVRGILFFCPFAASFSV